MYVIYCYIKQYNNSKSWKFWYSSLEIHQQGTDNDINQTEKTYWNKENSENLNIFYTICKPERQL